MRTATLLIFCLICYALSVDGKKKLKIKLKPNKKSSKSSTSEGRKIRTTLYFTYTSVGVNPPPITQTIQIPVYTAIPEANYLRESDGCYCPVQEDTEGYAEVIPHGKYIHEADCYCPVYDE